MKENNKDQWKYQYKRLHKKENIAREHCLALPQIIFSSHNRIKPHLLLSKSQELGVQLILGLACRSSYRLQKMDSKSVISLG